MEQRLRQQQTANSDRQDTNVRPDDGGGRSSDIECSRATGGGTCCGRGCDSERRGRSRRKRRTMCCATAALAGLVLTTTAIALQNKRTTFTEAELWGIYGGGEMAEKCCKDLALCRFVTDQCDDWTGNGDPFLNMEKCEKSNQVDTFVGNRKFCLFLQPGANCLETGTHICSRKTRCKWDADDQTCKLSNIDPFEMTAPVKCVPVCPQRPGF